MEFDERLHRAFDSLAERLHQEIAAQLNAARADLSASVQADRDAAVAEATDLARQAAEREAAERFTDRLARMETDRRTETKTAQVVASERLVDAVRAIDASHSLSEILDVLLAASATEAGRAVIFLPQGSTLKGWRSVGFESLAADSSNVELPIADGGMIGEAGETGRLIRLDPGAPRAAMLPAFVDLPAASRALAVPLLMTDQVLAVLYVDDGRNEAMAHDAWPAAIEVLARHAARALEATTATRLAQVLEVVSR
jgi:hypothetical protein